MKDAYVSDTTRVRRGVILGGHNGRRDRPEPTFRPRELRERATPGVVKVERVSPVEILAAKVVDDARAAHTARKEARLTSFARSLAKQKRAPRVRSEPRTPAPHGPLRAEFDERDGALVTVTRVNPARTIYGAEYDAMMAEEADKENKRRLSSFPYSLV